MYSPLGYHWKLGKGSFVSMGPGGGGGGGGGGWLFLVTGEKKNAFAVTGVGV